MQTVLARNPVIKAEDFGHDAATARITSAGALDDPMLSYTSAPRSIDSNIGYRQIVQISQKFPWPGTLDLRSEAATIEAKSAEYKVIDARLRLASQARAAYADWYYVFRAIAINFRTIRLTAHIRSVAQAAYASGQAPQQDVLQAEVELTRLEDQSLELKQRRQTVQARIDALLNEDPGYPVGRPEGLPLPPIVHGLKDLAATALMQYPTLRSADAEIAARRDRVELAGKAFYPSLQVMAGENTLWSLPQQQFTVGVAINIPISGKHYGDYNEAKARLRQSQFQLISERNALLSGLSQTYAALEQDRETISLYDRRLVPLASLNLKAADSDYSAGRGDFLKVITAEQQYLMADLERERARADYYTQFAALDYKTGGAVLNDGLGGSSK
ncbi:TolC family protein [Lichenicoccus sp.]|uniref:TolC family protein n=1 Tax=Lichenicoccus sp. TaxID=2781899 RepID=UPI003D0D55C0